VNLDDQLAARERAGLLRTMQACHGRDFTSNDYLGLGRDPRLAEAMHEGAMRWGSGGRAARLLAADHSPYEEAERAAADWLGAERTLLLPSGYHANLALLPAFAETGDVILSDKLNHASIIDGCRLSRAQTVVFDHCNTHDLQRHLSRSGAARRRIVVTESVFSMDGDRAPLTEYAHLAEQFDAHLIVDEAHAAGVFGPGLAAGLPHVLARVVTGGKALGVAGAFVAGSNQVIEWLVQQGRPFIFSTAPPPAVATALTAAIAIVREERWRGARAIAAAARLRAQVPGALGDSAIVPVVIGAADATMRAAAALREQGFDVRGVRPPTVPEGSSRLRIVCHSDHTDEEIDRLSSALRALLSSKALVVVGTDTGVGKTHVAARLLKEAMPNARYLKPVQTGMESDAETVARLTGTPPEPPLFHFARPASIDQASDRRLTVDEVATAVRARIAREPDATWILECAGGLLVPYNDSEDQADLLVRLGFPLVLVARSGLGTLNHTRLTVEAIRARGLFLDSLVLVGPPHPPNIATLQQWLPGLRIVVE